MKTELGKGLNARAYDAIQLVLLLVAFGSAFLVGPDFWSTIVGMVVAGFAAAASLGVMWCRRFQQRTAAAVEHRNEMHSAEEAASEVGSSSGDYASVNVGSSSPGGSLSTDLRGGVDNLIAINYFTHRDPRLRKQVVNQTEIYVPYLVTGHVVSVRDVLLSIKVARQKLLGSEWEANPVKDSQALAGDQESRRTELFGRRPRRQAMLH